MVGQVQFVGFRYFTDRKAKQLGIVGTVGNLDDGSVRVIGEGEEDKLNELVSYLKKGPAFAKVENVEVVSTAPQGVFTDFQIIF